MYKPSGSYFKEFTTASPTTGAAANADSLPVATANHNGTDDGSFALTVTNIDAGRYKVTGTVPSGYAAGDVVNVTVAATCGGVAGKATVDTFGVDTKRTSDALTVGTVNDKSGYSLADASVTSAKFSTGSVNASATGILERLLLLVLRFFPATGGSVTAPKSGNGSLVIRGGGGSPIASQAVSDDGTTQTLGVAS